MGVSPLTPAIFGLVGVFVGGVLNGLVSWRLERWKQRNKVRALARVLSDELGSALTGIHVARNDNEPYAFRMIKTAPRALPEGTRVERRPGLVKVRGRPTR